MLYDSVQVKNVMHALYNYQNKIPKTIYSKP